VFEKPNRFVDRVFLHCSDSPNAQLEGRELHDAVFRWHVTERGWDDIGYHFLIDMQGLVMKARKKEDKPAAQRGHNRGTIAIMLHGRDAFTEEQFNSLANLCQSMNVAYEGRLTFHGHCEVSSKLCPNFDYKDVLKLDGFGRMPFKGEE